MSWSFLQFTIIFQNAYFGLYRSSKWVEICKKWLFFNFNWAWDMGCAKWPYGSGEYFYYWGRPSPTVIHRDMGPLVGQNDRKSLKKKFSYRSRKSKCPKIIRIFNFWVCNMGCPIEWAHGGDHFWYSDRLVNSAISESNRADSRSVGKFSYLPFQILSLAQGRKNWSPAPQWAACGSWGQSHSDLKKWGAI